MFKVKIIGFITGIILAVFVGNSFAYKVSTHRKITETSLTKSENYNRFKSDFGIDGMNLLIDGSELEDGESEDDWRWFNHYYDPVNQQGLNLPVVGVIGMTAKEWGYDGLCNYRSLIWVHYRSFVRFIEI